MWTNKKKKKYDYQTENILDCDLTLIGPCIV